MIAVQHGFPDLDSAERAVVRLRAVGVPLTEIFLVGPEDRKYAATLKRQQKPVAPGSYLVAAHVATAEEARLLEKVLANEALTGLELERLRQQIRVVEPLDDPWHAVEVEFTPYGIAPEHHPPVDEGGPLTGEE